MAIKFNGTNQNILLSTTAAPPLQNSDSNSILFDFIWNGTGFEENNFVSDGLILYFPFEYNYGFGYCNEDIHNALLLQDDTLTYNIDSNHPLGSRFVTNFSSGKYIAPTSYSRYPVSSYVPIGNTPFTCCSWVKVNNGDNTVNSICYYGEIYALQFRQLICYADGKFGLNTNWQDLNSSNYNTKSTSIINDGEWHFIVATWSGSVCNLYLDGNLDGTSSSMTTFNTANNYFFVSDDPPSNRFSGSLSMLRIYNKVLTPEEIGIIFQGENNCTKLYQILAMGNDLVNFGDVRFNYCDAYLKFINNAWKLIIHTASHIFSSDGKNSNYASEIVSITSISPNTKYQICLRYLGDSIGGHKTQLYINSLLDQETNPIYNIYNIYGNSTTNHYITIGSRLGANYFDGEISNFRIYTDSSDFTLTASDIKNIFYNQGSDTVVRGLKMKYLMVGENNSVVSNLANNGSFKSYTPTINNSPTFQSESIKLFKPKRINQIFVEGE